MARRLISLLAVVMLVAGCGAAAASSTAGSTATAHATASATPGPLSPAYAASVAAVAAAGSVHIDRIDGTQASGTATTIVATTDTSATGSISYVQIGGAQVTVISDILYITPNQQLSGNCECAAGTFLAGHCYRVSSNTANQLGADPKEFLNNSPMVLAEWMRQYPMTVSGRGTVEGVTATLFTGAGGVSMAIPASGPPLPLTMAEKQTFSTTFSKWNAPLTITAPSGCTAD